MTNHTNALLSTLSKPTRPPRRAVAVTPADPLRCKGKCPGGHRCCLSVRDGRYHALCCCDDSECYCHCEKRYLADKARRTGFNGQNEL